MGFDAFKRVWVGHRVWFATAAILAILFFTDAPQGVESLGFTFNALIKTAPFLLLSIAIAAFDTASGADNIVARAFTRSPVKMIVFAAAVGGLSPFCSCGVISLIAAFLAIGVPL